MCSEWIKTEFLLKLDEFFLCVCVCVKEWESGVCIEFYIDVSSNAVTERSALYDNKIKEYANRIMKNKYFFQHQTAGACSQQEKKKHLWLNWLEKN